MRRTEEPSVEQRWDAFHMRLDKIKDHQEQHNLARHQTLQNKMADIEKRLLEVEDKIRAIRAKVAY